MKETVSIIGMGRFGKVLYEILKDDFNVLVYDVNPNISKEYNSIFSNDFTKLYSTFATFIAVPISQFEKVVKNHSKYFSEKTLILDVLSVKLFPKKVISKYMSTGIRAILTHPMFGPDSYKSIGIENLPIVISNHNSTEQQYSYWRDYFIKKKLKVVELAPNIHDRLAAKSQGVAHFIGRILKAYDLQSTVIDTYGARKLKEVMDQTCNDTIDLFKNLQIKNPYTKLMRASLGRAYDKTTSLLFPINIEPGVVTFGIQGGKASFNELAIMDYINRHNIKNYKIKYLYTSEKVLKNLTNGNIDFGIFAIHNSVGGIVNESINAIAKYKFKIVEEFAIKIRHFLMKRKEVSTNDINIIMAHDQVFKQCKSTLASRYPNLSLVTGKGDLIDGATVAAALMKGKINPNTFMLGNIMIANLFGLEVVDSDLQDNLENFTSFLLVKRY